MVHSASAAERTAAHLTRFSCTTLRTRLVQHFCRLRNLFHTFLQRSVCIRTTQPLTATHAVRVPNRVRIGHMAVQSSPTTSTEFIMTSTTNILSDEALLIQKMFLCIFSSFLRCVGRVRRRLAALMPSRLHRSAAEIQAEGAIGTRF